MHCPRRARARTGKKPLRRARFGRTVAIGRRASRENREQFASSQTSSEGQRHSSFASLQVRFVDIFAKPNSEHAGRLGTKNRLEYQR